MKLLILVGDVDVRKSCMDPKTIDLLLLTWMRGQQRRAKQRQPTNKLTKPATSQWSAQQDTRQHKAAVLTCIRFVNKSAVLSCLRFTSEQC